MTKLLTPKLDLVFKSLFSQDTELLVDLINAVLNRPDKERITSVELLNPGIIPETVMQKFIILDIRATDETGRQYDIEMQVRRYDDYNQRTIYYLSRMYAEQLKTGEEYDTLKPVVGIHFLDYELFPDYADCHFCFEMRDRRYPELSLTDDLVLHIFEMPKAKRLKDKEKLGIGMAEWLYFFNHAHKEGDRKMRTHYANKNIIKAFDILERLSADEKTRMLAEQRERALKDEASLLGAARRQGEKIGLEKGQQIGLEEGQQIGLEKGQQIGLEKGQQIGLEKGQKIGLEKGQKIGLEQGARNNAINTAAKLLQIGVLSVEQIADVTGLGQEDVKALQKEAD